MSFTKLPTELQIQIFSYLSNTDLKAARGVNRSCRDNASVWLFRTIVACARYHAMGAFQKISLHPVYQEYVKEIVFDATEYDRTLAENERNYQCVADREENLKDLVSWHRHSRFKKYQLLYREQEEMKDGGILLQTVAKALDWMPHVHSIVYSPRAHHIPVESKDMREILPRQISTDYRSHSRIIPQSHISTISENGFHHLIGAVALARYTKVCEFRVESYPDDFTQSFPEFSFGFKNFLFAQPSHLESGKYFFRNLTQIELTLKASYSSTPHESFANMRALLSEAKDLRHLRVCLLHPVARVNNPGFTAVVTGGHSIFACMGLTTEWDNLRSVDLEGIHATEQQLVDLVNRGKATLESIKFSYCALTTGKWSNLVEEVVYGTNIGEFILDHVNEEYVGDVLFRHLPSADAELWSYEGQVGYDANGERYFDGRPGKSVYAWRNLLSEVD